MKKFYLLIFCFAISFKTTAQTTITLSVKNDNSIYQNNNNSNALGENFFAGYTNSGSIRRALIRFDIAASIPPASVITAVTLTLNCNLTIAAATNVTLHKLNSDWGEGSSNAGSSNDGTGTAASPGDATWFCNFANGSGACSSAWANSGGDYVATVSASTPVANAGADYTWADPAMVTDVQDWLNNPSANFGWIVIGDESASPSAKRFGSKENSTLANRPKLLVTYTTTTMPVLLSFFKAKEIKDGVLLSWETAQEFNNAFFSVEHSTDGINFSAIGKVNGAGTSSNTHSYRFRHEGITAGNHFYRLAQTDLNNATRYSAINMINVSKASFNVQVNPNPVIDKIILQSSAGRIGNRYKIIGPNGTMVLAGLLNATGIDVRKLASGLYLLQIQEEGGTILTDRFVKK